MSDVRSKLNISEEYLFQTNDNFDILKEDEEDYTIEDSLIDDSKIILKKKVENKNTPLEKSEYIKDKDNLKIYLYPTDELNEEEE